MKRKVLAGLVAAGVLGVSGAAFAGVNVNVKISVPSSTPAAKVQRQLPPEPPEGFNGQRPPTLSRDIRNFNSKDRPPMPPKSGDRRPPHGPRSGDKKPPMPPKSGDKRPPMPPRSGDKAPRHFNSR